MHVSFVTIYPEPHMILSIKFNKYLLNYLSGNLNETVDNEGVVENTLSKQVS